jgi:hypothetical protein
MNTSFSSAKLEEAHRSPLARVASDHLPLASGAGLSIVILSRRMITGVRELGERWFQQP